MFCSAVGPSTREHTWNLNSLTLLFFRSVPSKEVVLDVNDMVLKKYFEDGRHNTTVIQEQCHASILTMGAFPPFESISLELEIVTEWLFDWLISRSQVLYRVLSIAINWIFEMRNIKFDSRGGRALLLLLKVLETDEKITFFVLQ